MSNSDEVTQAVGAAVRRKPTATAQQGLSPRLSSRVPVSAVRTRDVRVAAQKRKHKGFVPPDGTGQARAGSEALGLGIRADGWLRTTVPGLSVGGRAGGHGLWAWQRGWRVSTGPAGSRRAGAVALGGAVGPGLCRAGWLGRAAS